MRWKSYLKNRSPLLKAFDGLLATSILALALTYAAAVYVRFFRIDDATRLKEEKIAQGEVLFDQHNCRTCHGNIHEDPASTSYPRLWQQNAVYIVGQLKDFKSGARNNGMSSVMRDVVGALSEEDMEKIALYLQATSP